MIKVRDKIFYGFGNFSYGALTQGLTSYLVFFGTSILGISGTVIGLMIAISVVWDAITDPLIGHISDNTIIGKWGRRHFYMLVGAIGLSISNVFMWSISTDLTKNQKVISLFVLVIIVKTFMTIFVTPYNALGAELTDDYDERTSIQAFRTAFFTLGLAFTAVVSMVLLFAPTSGYPQGQLNPTAYRNMGVTISIIVLVFCMITIFDTKKFIPNLPKNIHKEGVGTFKSLSVQFRTIFKNKDYINVTGAYLSANIASAIVGSIGLHVFTYTFGMTNYNMGFLFAVIFLASILSQFFWVDITKKMDKRNAALIAIGFSLVSSLIFLLFVFMREVIREQYLYFVIYGVLLGIGFGGLITIPFSMIADTIDEEELVSGHRAEGLYYGGMSFSYKMSQSVAIFLLGVILDLVGFNPDLKVQPESTLLGLGLILAIGTIIVLLIAGSFYYNYSITKQKAEDTKQKIIRMRKV